MVKDDAKSPENFVRFLSIATFSLENDLWLPRRLLGVLMDADQWQPDIPIALYRRISFKILLKLTNSENLAVHCIGLVSTKIIIRKDTLYKKIFQNLKN